MAEIGKHHETFGRYQTDVFALSTDNPDQSLAMKKEMELPFEMLCDPSREVIQKYELLNSFEHGGVAIPAVLIINGEGILCFKSVGKTSLRTKLEEIFFFLEKQSKDKNHQLTLKKGQKLVIPSPGILWQLGRNFMLRGNHADWQHLLFFPWGILKKMGAHIGAWVK